MPQSAQLVRLQVWQARLARFQAETITVVEFCRREGVAVPSFYQWKKRLGHEVASSFDSTPDRQLPLAPPAFASLRLTDLATDSMPVLRLPGGASIELDVKASSKFSLRVSKQLRATSSRRPHDDLALRYDSHLHLHRRHRHAQELRRLIVMPPFSRETRFQCFADFPTSLLTHYRLRS